MNDKLQSKPTTSTSKSNQSNSKNIESNSGRIGPPKTIFDIIDEYPLVNISKDKLTIQSQSAFSTIKANVAVFKGKWMYEVRRRNIIHSSDEIVINLIQHYSYLYFFFQVQLRSKGVMQIGWCSAKCKFTQDTGVGDTKYSYGLDGSKQRVWHVYTHK